MRNSDHPVFGRNFLPRTRDPIRVIDQDHHVPNSKDEGVLIRDLTQLRLEGSLVKGSGRFLLQETFLIYRYTDLSS